MRSTVRTVAGQPGARPEIHAEHQKAAKMAEKARFLIEKSPFLWYNKHRNIHKSRPAAATRSARQRAQLSPISAGESKQTRGNRRQTVRSIAGREGKQEKQKQKTHARTRDARGGDQTSGDQMRTALCEPVRSSPRSARPAARERTQTNEN